MELIGFILLVPGAIDAGLGDLRFWAPLLGGFVIAWPFAFAVNRVLIRRGKATPSRTRITNTEGAFRPRAG